MSFWKNATQFLGLEEEILESSPLKLQQTESQKRRNKVKKKGRVIDFPNQKHSSKMNISQNDVMIVEPRVYEDSLTVSTYLKRGNPVVVNIKHLDAATGKRFVDFICGSAYAFEGHMHRLGGTIFIFTPAHMAIVPTQTEELSQTRPSIPEGMYEEEVVKYDEAEQNFDSFEYYDPAAPEETNQEAIYA